MRYKKLKLCVVLSLCFGLTGLQAQEAIPTTGGNAFGSGGSVTYTLGQVVYTTNTGLEGSVAQGVQQPYEISLGTGQEEAVDIILQCTANPNPTTDILLLEVGSYIDKNLYYYLYSMNGKLIETKKVESFITTISMGALVPATYFLKVIQLKHASSPQKSKIFKIIKTNR